MLKLLLLTLSLEAEFVILLLLKHEQLIKLQLVVQVLALHVGLVIFNGEVKLDFFGLSLLQELALDLSQVELELYILILEAVSFLTRLIEVTFQLLQVTTVVLNPLPMQGLQMSPIVRHLALHPVQIVHGISKLHPCSL